MKMKRHLVFVSLIYTLFLFDLPVKGKSLAAERSTLFTVNFEGMDAGMSPKGFTVALTGRGIQPIWTVENRLNNTQSSYVLIQSTADATGNRFPLCVYDDFNAKNMELSVQFLPLSGRIDQAAGLVWRYQDKNNYYVVRANALEDNVVLYKMEKGKRSDLRPVGAGIFSYGKDVAVPVNQWSTLQVKVEGDRFAVFLNDEHLFDVRDETFNGAGKVGLWTRAESVTAFDNLVIKSTDPQR